MAVRRGHSVKIHVDGVDYSAYIYGIEAHACDNGDGTFAIESDVFFGHVGSEHVLELTYCEPLDGSYNAIILPSPEIAEQSERLPSFRTNTYRDMRTVFAIKHKELAAVYD